MSEGVMWLAIALAGIAVQRWWYWKREAYRTRDAATASFEAIEDIVLGRERSDP